MAFRVVQNCQRRRFARGVQVSRQAMAMRAVSSKTVNISNAEAAKVTALNNGVRFATESAGGNLASFSVVVNAGSAHEGNGQNGVANLLQNAASKAAEAKKIGAQLTGHTTRENTTYTISCLKEDAAQAVSILGQLVNAPLSADVLEEARSEVLAGRKALWNVVNEEVVMDFLYSSAYQGTPLQNTVAGEIAQVKGISLNDVHAFRAQQYSGSNVVVSGAGALDHAQLASLVESTFSGLPQSSVRYSNARVPYTGSMMHIRDNTVHEIQVAVGYETFSLNHKHVLTLAVLRQLIGEWNTQSLAGTNSSSRLAESLSTQKFVDRFHTFANFNRNTGLFGVYASTTNENSLDDLVYEIFNEYQKLFTYISPEELYRAKNGLKSKLLASEETTSAQSKHIGEQFLNLDRRVSLAEAFNRIDAISTNDVKEVLDTYFYDVDPVVVAHGNLEEMPDYVVMRNWTYWNRW